MSNIFSLSLFSFITEMLKSWPKKASLPRLSVMEVVVSTRDFPKGILCSRGTETLLSLTAGQKSKAALGNTLNVRGDNLGNKMPKFSQRIK